MRRLLDDGANVDGDVESATSNASSSSGLYGTITRPIYAAAISGSLKSLGLLLKEGAALDQSVLDMVIERNSRRGVDVLTTIMEARPGLEIINSTMNASGANFNSKEVLNYILDHQKNITKSQLEAIAHNYKNCPSELDILEKIVSYGKKHGCDGDQMLRACNQSKTVYAYLEIRVLIDRYDPSNSMRK